MNQRHISRRQFPRAGSWAVAGAVVVDVAPRIFLPPWPREFGSDWLNANRFYPTYLTTRPATLDLSEESLTKAIEWIRANSHDQATVMRLTALALRGRAV